MKILEMYSGSKSEDLKQRGFPLIGLTGSSLPDLILAKLPYLFFGLLILCWFAAPKVIGLFDPTAGTIDPSIWQLILLSLICFLLILGLCWWLIRQFWKWLGFPAMDIMVSQFKKLESWQQLSFCWASFALLLFAAVGVLSAVV